MTPVGATAAAERMSPTGTAAILGILSIILLIL